MSLYNNQKQEELFHLKTPFPTPDQDCAVLQHYFPNFLSCNKSKILAYSTGEFNCIGWAIGVKQFINPVKDINKYYKYKSDTGFSITAKYPNGATSSTNLKNYQKDSPECKKAVKLFFDHYSQKSVLPKKNDYIAVDEISYPPEDDTIAFYFKDGEETFDSNEIKYKGFQHASRYVKDVNSWVSDVWTSKLGEEMLITHMEHELDGVTYGYILCYLVPVNHEL